MDEPRPEAMTPKEFEEYAGRKVDKALIVYVGKECWSRMTTPGKWVLLDP